LKEDLENYIRFCILGALCS